jgi:hypothetical protein
MKTLRRLEHMEEDVIYFFFICFPPYPTPAATTASASLAGSSNNSIRRGSRLTKHTIEADTTAPFASSPSSGSASASTSLSSSDGVRPFSLKSNTSDVSAFDDDEERERKDRRRQEQSDRAREMDELLGVLCLHEEKFSESLSQRRTRVDDMMNSFIAKTREQDATRLKSFMAVLQVRKPSTATRRTNRRVQLLNLFRQARHDHLKRWEDARRRLKSFQQVPQQNNTEQNTMNVVCVCVCVCVCVVDYVSVM